MYKKLLSTVFILTILVLIFNIRATALEKTLKGDLSSTYKVTLSWDEIDSASYYIITRTFYCKEVYFTTNDSSYIDNSKKEFGVYTYSVSAFSDGGELLYNFNFVNIEIKMEDDNSFPITVSVGKVKILTLSSSKYNTAVMITDKSGNVSGYEIYRKSDSDWKKIKTVTSSKFTDKTLKPNRRYYYKIRPYFVFNGKNIYGDYSSVNSIVTKLNKVGGCAITNNKSAHCTLSWDKVKYADGYKVYYKKTGKKYKLYKTVNNLYCKFKNLDIGSKYFFKVRAYVNIESKKYYGEYSSVKSYLPKLLKPKITVDIKGKTAKLKITNLTDADGYKVYLANNTSSHYKRVATLKGIKKTTYYYKMKKYGKYCFKVRSYYKVGKKSKYSEYSNSVTYNYKR